MLHGTPHLRMEGGERGWERDDSVERAERTECGEAWEGKGGGWWV